MLMVTRRRAAHAAALLALGAFAACGGKEGGRSDYANDGDSGAAAPATVQTPDASQPPDSTSGISERTGRPGVAGDTLGSRAKTPTKTP